MADITTSINLTLPMLDIFMTGKGHSNFDHIHLNSARIFAEHALNIENNPKYKESPQEAPEAVKSLYLSYVSSSIICSVATLEANINKYIVDNYDTLDNSSYSTCDVLYEKYEKLNRGTKIIQQLLIIPTVKLKYDVVTFLLTCKFIPHCQKSEKMDYLIDLRNALMHFTPEWDNALKKHKSLENSKKNFFKCSPFYEKGFLFFPYRCLSASCAVWSHATACEYIEYFTSLK